MGNSCITPKKTTNPQYYRPNEHVVHPTGSNTPLAYAATPMTISQGHPQVPHPHAQQRSRHGAPPPAYRQYPHMNAQMIPQMTFGNMASMQMWNNTPIQQNQVAPMHQPSQPPKDKTTRVRALYSYSARNDDDLNFTKGDILFVSSNLEEDWWLARHSKDNSRGYIPSNYVVIDNGLPESHDAWYEISRREADRKLLLPGNPRGTFILRPSAAQPNFALSIRHFDQDKQIWLIKHYKIKRTDNGNSFFINEQYPFHTIHDLISYYSRKADGLCCELTVPCPRTYKPPAEFREFEVARECFSRIKYLGKGSFGEVFLAKWNNSIEVAIKTHLPSTDVTAFLNEAKTMQRLNHPRIVRLLGVCTKPADQPIYIITELMPKGALVDMLRSPECRATHGLDNFIDFMAQIAEGMAYLEEMKFIHRDLRAANILVAEDNSVKVSDFGLARIFQLDEKADPNIRFPIKWTAPEAANRHQFTTKSDVWSFGVLMYEIVTYGKPPYPTMSNKDVLREVERGHRMPNPHSPETPCPADLYNIMLGCWNDKPDGRPTFASLYNIFSNWTSHQEEQYIDQ